MKNLWLAVGVAALMLGSACNRQGKTDNIDIIQSYVSKGEVIVADSLPVTLPIEQGCGRVVIRKAPRQTVDVVFDVQDADLLYGKILDVSDTANIRISQIVLPDGSGDGPFGRTVEYDLPMRGAYHLRIGENMMAGEPWGGDFFLELFLGTKIPYTLGRNYFVRNDYEAERLSSPVIATQEQFDAVFDGAAVMGAQPTPIDFSRQYVIAIVEPATDQSVHYTVRNLARIDGKLVLQYRREVGEKRSYSVRPFLMMVVDTLYDGPVELLAE